jgi:hypothetical protein
MADRLQSEIVHDACDSASEVRDIDVNIYDTTAVPKGYVRVSHVEQDICPVCNERSAP